MYYKRQVYKNLRKLLLTLVSLFIIISLMKLQVRERYEKESCKRSVFTVRNLNGSKTYNGPGEGGKAVFIRKELLSSSNRAWYEEAYSKHGFNVFVSDMISLERSLPKEAFPETCRSVAYRSDLPKASVIIPFRDEAWSSLLRTVHSVLNRTPPQFLREVILVDDGSESDELKYKLDVYLSFLSKVRLRRLPKTRGLSFSRQTGIDDAKSDIIVVMDSHFEVAEGWYQPMAKRIIENPSLLLVPVVDTIDHATLQYFPSEMQPNKMDCTSFDFYLGQTRILMKQSYISTLPKPIINPIKLPAFQGGYFMANKTVFQKLGGFDRGFGTWGGEQMELSFKYWMCAGGLELIPCSRAGHVYRTKVLWSKDIANETVLNEYRVAEVWMDDYKSILFEMAGNHTHKTTGDVSARHEVRKRNNCTSFQAYLDTISQFVHQYVPRDLKASGVLVSISTKLCLDGTTMYSRQQAVVTYGCHFTGHTQYWEMSSDREIRHGLVCITSNKEGDVVTIKCQEDGSKYYKWTYTKDNKLIEEKTQKCMTSTEPYGKVIVSDCNGGSHQTWVWTRRKNK